MSLMKMLNVVALVLMAGISLTFAREANEGELKSLNEAAKVYQTATEKGDIQTLISSISPRSLKFLAEKDKKDEKQIIEELQQQFTAMTAMVKFVDCDLHLDKKLAGELDDGSPYFLVPLTSVIEVNGQKARIDAKLAAVLDDGKWYFVTGNAENKEIMAKTYPGLEKAEFGEPVATPLGK